MHVIALVNTLNLKKLGHLGTDQLEFIQKDVAPLSSDTPIIVFSHIPLFAMYPDWGWGTDDATQALSYLRRFSSVTCLNGHVHQLFTKTEGNITFHSGTTTAYPLPHPGDGPAPKPVTLPAGKLHDALGIREVSYTKGQQALALKEQTAAMNTISPPGCVRVGIGATLAVSGVIHAYLYVHGYRYIPTIGPAFLLQASVFLCSGRADPRRRTGLAAVGRGCGLRRGAGRVRAVADCRALRVHRTRMAAVTACRRQRDRRGAHRGIGCRLGADQPQQNRSNITAVTQIAAGLAWAF